MSAQVNASRENGRQALPKTKDDGHRAGTDNARRGIRCFWETDRVRVCDCVYLAARSYAEDLTWYHDHSVTVTQYNGPISGSFDVGLKITLPSWCYPSNNQCERQLI